MILKAFTYKNDCFWIHTFGDSQRKISKTKVLPPRILFMGASKTEVD